MWTELCYTPLTCPHLKAASIAGDIASRKGFLRLSRPASSEKIFFSEQKEDACFLLVITNTYAGTSLYPATMLQQGSFFREKRAKRA